MKKFKELAYTDKSISLEKKGIYTVICNTRTVKKSPQLTLELTKLLGVQILKVRKLNCYSNGYVKLYVKVKDSLQWLSK